jgi:hypothetical protein
MKHDNNESSSRKIDPNNKELPKPESSDIAAIDSSSNITSTRNVPAQDKSAKKQIFWKIQHTSYQVPSRVKTLTSTTQLHATAERK